MIDFRSLPRGAVCTLYPDYRGVPWWKKLILRQAYWGIRRTQHNIWPHGQTDAIHLMVKIANGASGKWFEMTSPCGRLVDFPVSGLTKARVFDYAYAHNFTEAQWTLFESYLIKLIGISYDYWQLVAIGINEAFHWTPHVDVYKRRTVCSCAVVGGFYAAWQAFPFGTGAQCALPAYGGRIYPKPNARLHNGTYMPIERVPPAFVENEQQWILQEEQGC